MRCVDVTVRTQILTRAREIVADGWLQGDLFDEDLVCLTGALAKAAYEHGYTYDKERPWDVLCRDLDLPEVDILVEFNDAPWTTQRDVLYVLDSWCARELVTA